MLAIRYRYSIKLARASASSHITILLLYHHYQSRLYGASAILFAQVLGLFGLQDFEAAATTCMRCRVGLNSCEQLPAGV